MFCLYEQWDFNPTTSHRFIRLCPRARKDLCWWTLPSNVFRGCMIVSREPTIHFLTDASLRGWVAHWGSHNIRVPREERRSHKHLGIGSGLQSVRHVATQVGGSGCPGRTGQLDSSCLHEQAGRHPITSTQSSGHIHSALLQRPRNDIESVTHSRGQERDCRRPVKKRGDCSG